MGWRCLETEKRSKKREVAGYQRQHLATVLFDDFLPSMNQVIEFKSGSYLKNVLARSPK